MEIRDVNYEAHDLEDLVPLELIREHTKTTDLMRVTDDQLKRYRMASIEAAELYTGFNLQGIKNVTENVQRHASVRSYRRFTKITLAHPVMDGIVTLISNQPDIPTRVVQVTPGATKVTIPVLAEAVDASSCCSPCSKGGENFGIQVTYRTGLKSLSEVPQGIIVGCLKFIAFTLANAGDEILTIRGRAASDSNGLVGSNNAAVSSGAAEQWNMYRNRA